jgi:hypothetical protein
MWVRAVLAYVRARRPEDRRPSATGACRSTNPSGRRFGRGRRLRRGCASVRSWAELVVGRVLPDDVFDVAGDPPEEATGDERRE